MPTESSVSSYTCSTDDGTRQRKEVEHLPKIGYSLDELNAKRVEPKWRITRIAAIAIFWGIWAALLAGSIVIVVLNDNDVASTTSAPITTTTKGK